MANASASLQTHLWKKVPQIRDWTSKEHYQKHLDIKHNLNNLLRLFRPTVTAYKNRIYEHQSQISIFLR